MSSRPAEAGAIFFSTTARNGAFLEWVLLRRDEMSPLVREGLVQFFYTSVVAHLESLMLGVSTELVRGMRIDVHLSRLKNAGAYRRMLQRRHDQLTGDQLAFSKLSSEVLPELLGESFEKLRQEFGPDLNALVDLRNALAHGRELGYGIQTSDAGGDPFDGGKVSIDSSKLQKAIIQLHRAGIVGRTNPEAGDHHELWGALHSDAALKYFYGKAMGFESRLMALTAAAGGQPGPWITALPEIQL